MENFKPHHVIIVLGLGELKNLYIQLTKHWTKKYNLIPHIYTVGWKDTDENFEQKLNKCNAYIESLLINGNIVSLIGTSAGGSMVLNSYISLKKKGIHVNGGLITLCGKLNNNTHWWYPFKNYSHYFPVFATSLENLQSQQNELTEEDKEKIYTFSALFDELVPQAASTIKGVRNERIFFILHVPSMMYQLFFANRLQNLLKIYTH